MRAPEFWQSDNGLARLLEPFGLAYAAAGAWRIAHTRPERAAVPVVCVGNLVAGGAGKTPVALSLALFFQARGRTVHFLTRGYGGVERGPLRVDPARHTPDDVGDEALLLALTAPTTVSRDRVAGARSIGGGAEGGGGGADVIIMDDGHQNPTLVKDLSLVVVDGGYGFGNGRVIPAGPLREPVRAGLARASAVLVMGEDTAGVAKRVPKGIPILSARLTPGAGVEMIRDRKVVAFAGIGRPEKFFALLRAEGAQVLAKHPFADHYPYAEADIQPILDEAYGLGAIPVTTAKDAIRLPGDQRRQVTVLNVAVAWEETSALERVLETVMRRG